MDRIEQFHINTSINLKTVYNRICTILLKERDLRDRVYKRVILELTTFPVSS